MKTTGMILMMLAISVAVWARPPAKLSYQGVLTDGAGNLVPDGNYNLTLSLYTEASGGTAVWTEGQLAMVMGGIFNVLLGSVVPLTSLSFDTAYYLGVAVSGGSELTPRTLLTSAAYALNAPVMAFGGSSATTELTNGAWINYEDDFATLNCPGPGYVIVQSSVWMKVEHTANTQLYFEVCHAESPTGAPDSYLFVSAYVLPATHPAGEYHIQMPVQTVFPVYSAGIHSYYLNGRDWDGSGGCYFYYASTVATWYPGSPPPPDVLQAAHTRKPMPTQH
jgi:hypothetical protein